MNSMLKLYESWHIAALECWVSIGTLFAFSVVKASLQPPVEAKILQFKRRGK